MELCCLSEDKRISLMSHKQNGKLDFVKPEYEIERIDSYDIRHKILNISYVDWKKLGFSKGTLHYMKQNPKSDKQFTHNSHVLERVNKWEVLVSGQK